MLQHSSTHLENGPLIPKDTSNLIEQFEDGRHKSALHALESEKYKDERKLQAETVFDNNQTVKVRAEAVGKVLADTGKQLSEKALQTLEKLKQNHASHSLNNQQNEEN